MKQLLTGLRIAGVILVYFAAFVIGLVVAIPVGVYEITTGRKLYRKEVRRWR